jgi:putative membrane protein insertion efficiency factor
MTAVRAAARAVVRIPALLLSGLVLLYKRLISPMLGPRCRFYPSCSTYALEALQVHGAAKGTVLATYRVCRCNPWNAGGVDHVPPKGSWKPEPYVPLTKWDDDPTTPDAGPAGPGPDTTSTDRSTAWT